MTARHVPAAARELARELVALFSRDSELCRDLNAHKARVLGEAGFTAEEARRARVDALVDGIYDPISEPR